MDIHEAPGPTNLVYAHGSPIIFSRHSPVLRSDLGSPPHPQHLEDTTLIVGIPSQQLSGTPLHSHQSSFTVGLSSIPCPLRFSRMVVLAWVRPSSHPPLQLFNTIYTAYVSCSFSGPPRQQLQLWVGKIKKKSLLQDTEDGWWGGGDI